MLLTGRFEQDIWDAPACSAGISSSTANIWSRRPIGLQNDETRWAAGIVDELPRHLYVSTFEY